METHQSRRCVKLTLLAAVYLSGSLASANTIIATGLDATRGENIWIQEDGTATQGLAGVIFITVNVGALAYNRDSLCVDLFTPIQANVTYNTTILYPYDVYGKHLDRVSWLVDNALLPTQDNTYTSTLPSVDWVRTAAQGAGIQLAIWDIVHDNGDGFAAGRVQAATGATHTTDASVLAWANTYEALSLAKSSTLAFVYQNVTIGTGGPAQMLAGPRFSDSGPVPTPEPATLFIAGTALIALSLLSRKRIRNR